MWYSNFCPLPQSFHSPVQQTGGHPLSAVTRRTRRRAAPPAALSPAGQTPVHRRWIVFCTKMCLCSCIAFFLLYTYRCRPFKGESCPTVQQQVYYHRNFPHCQEFICIFYTFSFGFSRLFSTIYPRISNIQGKACRFVKKGKSRGVVFFNTTPLPGCFAPCRCHTLARATVATQKAYTFCAYSSPKRSRCS